MVHPPSAEGETPVRVGLDRVLGFETPPAPWHAAGRTDARMNARISTLPRVMGECARDRGNLMENHTRLEGREYLNGGQSMKMEIEEI